MGSIWTLYGRCWAWLTACTPWPLLQVSDTKPKRPQWGLLSSGEVHTTTIAAWAHLVILGDADGNLNRWDTTT